MYNQKIDPTNQMPTTANQQPAEGQTTLLNTERVASSIPKAGTTGTWVYPSPQMVSYHKCKRDISYIYCLHLHTYHNLVLERSCTQREI